ncbi:hypothetical protein EV384_3825 [Micromonospora kangleipakensis]|uniref:DUF6545 domain-containing protein n=1 Tax=Micromonospora kangleipakensis TaxID=1077942 RepID=A0A4Q8BDM9_9ACTN|nr:MAB_1171c family putative transporter [Micromonospora kangleipakensis]RZU75293.1 hypothetical protein EV384_3825 [Micromonospora kangleipakensis]
MSGIVPVAMVVVPLACWGMSLYKLRDLARDPGNRPLRALCVALWSITLALTVQPVGPWLDQRLGVLDVARLTGNCLTLVCVTAGQAFHLYMTGTDAATERRVRRRSVLLAIAVATMIVLFIRTPPAADLADPRVLSRAYYAEPFDAPCLYVYLAYLGWSLAQMALLANRYAGIAHRPLLRFGLRLITVAAMWGLLYVAGKLVAVVAGVFQPGLVPAVDSLVILCFTTSILLALIGSTIPSWGPLVGLYRLWAWAGALRDYYRLHPLWRRIHAVLPQIALLPPPSGLRGFLSVARDASLRRVRITVEILDGYAGLRPWMSAEVAAAARRVAREQGLPVEEQAVVVEAAVIGAALRARRQGGSAAVPGDPAVEVPFQDPKAGDLGAADQVTWLARVARALATPTVEMIIARAAPPVGMGTPGPAGRP